MKSYLHNPLFIKWNITNQCDLRCKFCFKKEYSEVNLSHQQIDIILDYIDEVNPISVTILGGEPTLSPYLGYILKELKKKEIDHTFSTNGQSLFQNDDLLTVIKNDSFLKKIQISMESPYPNKNDSIRGNNSFNNAIKTINTLTSLNIPVEIGTVLTKENYCDIDEMINLCRINNVSFLRLIPFLPIEHGKNGNIKNKFFLTSIEIESILSKYKNITEPSIISDYSTKKSAFQTYGCGAGITTLNINPNMTLSACDVLSDYEQSGAIFSKEDIKHVWNNDPIFNNWRDGGRLDALSCNQCALFKECGGYAIDDIELASNTKN